MTDLRDARERMVRTQIAARGIRDPAVLDALRTVPREAFLPPALAEFAYEDHPLPIAHGQTISQPYVVALMAVALRLRGEDRVLEVGTGSGYAAAILGRIAREVYTIERHAELAAAAAARLRDLGFDHVHVRHGDGTLGWPEHAPYDAIVVTAGGPRIPEALLEQLAVGGRLVIPIGEEKALQTLVRVTREADGRLRQEDLGDVRFVPLIGAQGWAEEEWNGRPARRTSPPPTVARLLRETAEPLTTLTPDADLGALIERIGDARLVLIGEATHGTSEFYALRAELTKALIRACGFTIVAAEADWPDAARIHRYVRGMPAAEVPRWRAFARFPAWMWRNHEVLAFVEWLRAWNGAHAPVGFYGLDLYSMYRSLRLVLEYLDRVDPETARIARERYGRLTPWEGDPATYGRAVLSGRYQGCEAEVVAMLRDLLARELEYAARDGEHFLDAVGNARVVANAERYYRALYYGGVESWNQRDRHMFETLEALLRFHGPEAKAILWEHNSHLGDAAATEMGVRGEINVGHLCRRAFGDRAYLVGFGTDHGTVGAAHDWDGPMEVMTVRPAHPESYERLCHDTGLGAFFLHLRTPARDAVRAELAPARLERAIGVVYRPDTELQSHYFHAALPYQFDEYVWFDATRAVRPVTDAEARGLPRAHPFAPYGPP
ncbi:MAG TPA: protein-L-isoaspartate(D-aspartate) O-methyltransferase [Candidatus Binatia bacterium]|nr:protein-L-isoaspartate(D-aspartate) O-methyltransferase [Candidatus Binatia bacterium]